MRGSVYKRCPHGTTGISGKPACRQKHGTWSWRADEPHSGAGKRKRPGEGGYASKEKAQEALNDYLSTVARGTAVDDQHITVGEWLDQWMQRNHKRVKLGTLQLKTVRGYETHIPPLKKHLGTIRLRDLKHHHVEDMIDALRIPEKDEDAPTPRRPLGRWQYVKCDEIKKGRKGKGETCANWAVHGGTKCAAHGGKPVHDLSPGPGRGGRKVAVRQGRTLDGYRRTLRAALAAAVTRDLVSRNVAAGEIDTMPPVGKADRRVWEPEQVAVFLADLEADVAKAEPKSDAWIAAAMEDALFEVALFGGLRRGELGGQMWFRLAPDGSQTPAMDIDGTPSGLTVGPTLSQLSGDHLCSVCRRHHRGYLLKPGPKSEASWRWVPLVEDTARKVRRHRLAQGLLRDHWGGMYEDHGLVFCQDNGLPLHPEWITDHFRARADRLGLPRIDLHEGGRHGACALLLAAGTPIETVSMILGHANPAITRSTYAHLLRGPALAGMQAAVELVRPTDAPSAATGTVRDQTPPVADQESGKTAGQ